MNVKNAKAMRIEEQHAAAQAQFKKAGFSYEYPGMFMSKDLNSRGLIVTCAFDWSGTGKWEAQVQYRDGTVSERDGKDFATVEGVIKFRDQIKKEFNRA
jgi:hypothetical protein